MRQDLFSAPRAAKVAPPMLGLFSWTWEKYNTQTVRPTKTVRLISIDRVLQVFSSLQKCQAGA